MPGLMAQVGLTVGIPQYPAQSSLSLIHPFSYLLPLQLSPGYVDAIVLAPGSVSATELSKV